RKAIELDLAEKKRGKSMSSDGAEANAAYIDSLGWVLFRLGKLDDARRELERAVKLSGAEEDPGVWDRLGDLYCTLDQRKQAVKGWEKAVQFYEQDRRRKTDDRYKEIKQKLETLGKTTGAR